MINSPETYKVLIPLVSVISGYFVGRYHTLFLEKRSRLRERFNNLYLPFEKLYFTETHGAFRFTELPLNLRQQFTSILYENKIYADSTLHEMIVVFKWMNDPKVYDSEDIDPHFHKIAVHIKNQHTQMAKKLFYKTNKKF